MKTFRILNLDGGGNKGLFSAYFMKKFCDQVGITPTEIWKHFDLIVGASIGAIMGCGYANGITPDDLINFFITYSPQIFRDPVTGSSPMGSTRKQQCFTSISSLGGRNFPLGTDTYVGGQSLYGGDTTVGSLGDQESNKPNTVLSARLQSVFGTKKMFELKTNVIIGAIERYAANSQQELDFSYRTTLFSNFIAEGLEGQNYLVWEATQASGSAPIYFPPMDITGAPTGKRYIDLGVSLNNMSGIGLAYSGIINPSIDKICMLSVGCGLGTVGFFDVVGESKAANGATNIGDNIEYSTQLIGTASTGAQEATTKIMDLFSRYNTKINNADFYHYRFNTVFDPDVNTELDNSGDEFNTTMLNACNTQYALDQLKINLFIQNCNFNN